MLSPEHKFRQGLFGMGVILVCFAGLTACQPAATDEPVPEPIQRTRTSTPTSARLGPTSTPTRIVVLEPGSKIIGASPTATGSPAGLPTGTSSADRVTPVAAPTETPSLPANPTSGSSAGTYPGPNSNTYLGPNPGAYPAPNPGEYPGVTTGETGTTTYPSQTGGIFGALGQTNPTLPAPPATNPPAASTQPNPDPTGTPVQRAAPTLVPTSASGGVFSPIVVIPGGANPVVEIWHAMGGSQLEVLNAIVRDYQLTFPQVSLQLTYFPPDDLRQAYETGVYQGRGPDLLIGPSNWNQGFARVGMVADLKPYFTVSFWDRFGASALETGQYQDKQTSFPFIQRGALLYRNRQIIPHPSFSFDQLVRSAQDGTRGGVIGAYFDLGAYFAMPFYDSLGGAWSDQAGNPTFDQNGYARALAWLDILAELDQAGAVEVNTYRDFSLFSMGKVGYILDGTWNLHSLSEALGAGNLAVDPWPTYGSGRLSGYLQAQSIYLNPVAAESQDSSLAAALQFMGALLSQPAQGRFVEAGFIPVRDDFQIRDPLIEQAFTALQDSRPYPAALQGEMELIYWSALEDGIKRGLGLAGAQSTALEALQAAFREIEKQIDLLP